MFDQCINRGGLEHLRISSSGSGVVAKQTPVMLLASRSELHNIVVTFHIRKADSVPSWATLLPVEVLVEDSVE